MWGSPVFSNLGKNETIHHSINAHVIAHQSWERWLNLGRFQCPQNALRYLQCGKKAFTIPSYTMTGNLVNIRRCQSHIFIRYQSLSWIPLDLANLINNKMIKDQSFKKNMGLSEKSFDCYKYYVNLPTFIIMQLMWKSDGFLKNYFYPFDHSV